MFASLWGFPCLVPSDDPHWWGSPVLAEDGCDTAADRPGHGWFNYCQMSLLWEKELLWKEKISPLWRDAGGISLCLPRCCVCISSRQLGAIHRRPEQSRKTPEDKEEKHYQLTTWGGKDPFGNTIGMYLIRLLWAVLKFKLNITTF